MKQRIFIAFGTILLALEPLTAQTQVSLQTQSKAADFSQFASVRPLPSSTSFPVTCLVGQGLFRTDLPRARSLLVHLPQYMDVFTRQQRLDPNLSGQFGKWHRLHLPGSFHHVIPAGIDADSRTWDYQYRQRYAQCGRDRSSTSPARHRQRSRRGRIAGRKCICNCL